MCRALGRGMHMVASALAPSEIVIVGDITNLWSKAAPIIESEMRRNRLVHVPRLRPARGGSQARLRTAVALVMNENQLLSKSRCRSFMSPVPFTVSLSTVHCFPCPFTSAII